MQPMRKSLVRWHIQVTAVPAVCRHYTLQRCIATVPPSPTSPSHTRWWGRRRRRGPSTLLIFSEGDDVGPRHVTSAAPSALRAAKPRHPGLGMPLSLYQQTTLAHQQWPRDPRRPLPATCFIEAGWIVERIEGITVVFQRRTHRGPLTTPNHPARPPRRPLAPADKMAQQQRALQA